MTQAQKIAELYLSGMLVTQVASEMNLGRNLVGLTIQRLGISRPGGKCWNRCPEFTSDFISYLDGLLISDASLCPPKGRSTSSNYGHSSVSQDWLESIQNRFIREGIQSKITTNFRRNKIGYNLMSLKYLHLFAQYHRWYRNGVKGVPKDIDFSNKSFLRNWIYGDGTRVGSSNSVLRLCTESFVTEDIDYLVAGLNRLGFEFKKVWWGKNKPQDCWRISIGKRTGLPEFLQFIGKCEIPSLDYKWNPTGERKWKVAK